MTRREFLEMLKNQLSGQMQEGRVAAHLRYYEDYIQSQIQKGRSEHEVMAELGDPHLIAKTLIDTNSSAGENIYEEAPEYRSDATYNYGSFEEEKPTKKYTLDLSTWFGKFILLAGIVLIIVVLFSVLATVAPFFIMFGLIVYVISRFSKK